LFSDYSKKERECRIRGRLAWEDDMKKRLLIVAGMVCALLLPLRAYALDRFVMGTYGNGIPLSGMTVEEAKTYLEWKYS